MERTGPHYLKTAHYASRWSIRPLLLWLVLACLLPGVIGTTLLFINQYREGRAQQERDTINTARALMQAIDSHLLRVDAIGEALATDSSLLQGNLAQFHERARKIVDTSGLLANIVLRDKNEQLVLNALMQFGKPLPVQPSREHVRQVFLTGKPAISTLYTVTQFKYPIISVDVPVLIDGGVKYSLGVSVSPEQINNILRAQKLPPGWVVAALDRSGTIVGRNINPDKFVGKKATPLLMQGLMKYREASIEATTLEGTPVQTSLSKSPITNWAVAIAIPLQSLQEAMLLSLAKLAGIVTVMFSIGLVLAWLMGGRIARSVRALTIPAMALGEGKDFQAPAGHIREVDEVGLAMDRAAKLLKERDSALRQREAEVAEAYTLLRNVIDCTPVLIYLKDLSGHLLLANKSYEKMIGVSPVSGRITIGRQYGSDLENEAAPSAADLKAIESGEIIHLEEDVSTEEGVKHFAVSKAPLRNPEGAISGICAAAIDITALKVAEAKIQVLVQTLEKRVEQRTEELNQANAHLQQSNEQLAQANDQLEAFSYTVAHDLRAPLRGINGFADAVIEDYGHLLDETGREYLRRICKAATRMERLIEDLLGFSRLSRMELSLGTVSLDEVLQEVMTNLSAQIQETHTTITVAPSLPFARANRTACVQIIQNLLSNAIKFARANERSCIKIWHEARSPGQQAQPMVRIWVEDNGIGIPGQQKERIFRPFERLHGIDEYQGSGIGLAIVATAVHRMHGRCGVESELGGGSRFWFELPAVTMESQ